MAYVQVRREQGARRLYFGVVVEGGRTIAVTTGHHAEPDEVERDLVAVSRSQVPEDSPIFAAANAVAEAEDQARTERIFDNGLRAGRRLRRRHIIAILIYALGLGVLLGLLAGCSHLPGLRHFSAPPTLPAALSATTPDGPQRATAQPILDAADAIDANAQAVQSAVVAAKVPALAATTAPKIKVILRDKTPAIRRDAVALADFGSRQAAAAYSAQAGPRRIWLWLTGAGMAVGFLAMLAGIALFIWAGRASGASMAIGGVVVMAASYFLAAYLVYIMVAVAGLAVAAVGVLAWRAHHNLHLLPPGLAPTAIENDVEGMISHATSTDKTTGAGGMVAAGAEGD